MMQRRLALRGPSSLQKYGIFQSCIGSRCLTISSKCLQIEKIVINPVADAPSENPSPPSTSQLPWYLRDNSSSKQNEVPGVDLPQVPEDSPESLSKMVELMASDYGLENVQLFDLTSLDDHHPFSSKNHLAKYIIIGSGKSPRHIQKAANELRAHIKHSHGVIPPTEGLVSSLMSPVERRRLLRRARKGPMATDNDYGRLPNSWVMFDTGVDGIHIHMMTPDRRRELQLESMYAPDYDPEAEVEYIDGDGFASESDNIFIGIRRGFHTMTAFAKAQRALHGRTYSQASEARHFQENPASQASSNSIESNHDFTFMPLRTHNDFVAEFEARKAAHLANPKTVSFEDVKNVLLKKNASWALAFSQDRDSDLPAKDDLVRFMKLLIDSPETEVLSQNLTIGEQADELLARVSHFMNKLMRFSSSNVDMYAHPEFVVLLWRLILRQNSTRYISVATIDAAIAEGDLFEAQGLVSDLASNRARDLIFLSTKYAEEHNLEPSREYQELVLFAYGNDNNWTAFWDTWERYFGMRAGETPETKDLTTKWVRLATYLAIRADKGAAAHFLGNHWHRSESVGVTFLHDYEISGKDFASESQRQAFLSAVERLLLVVSGHGDAKFAYVRRTLAELQSSIG